ncbi:MAG TPA: VOC family protein [Acidimicrobiia bacterium]|nr:VOC family protein [Acidimicrobiia bacterium]
MLTAVDHIVINVYDLDTAMDSYRRLGFTVTPVGGAGYIGFGDFHVSLRELGPGSEGLHTLGLRSDDVVSDRGRLEQGVPIGDVVLPVEVVDQHEAGEVRRSLGSPESHPNTVTVPERVYVAVESIDRELVAFEEALGMAAPEPEMGTVIMSMMSVFYLGAIGVAVAEPRGEGPTADALSSNGPGMFQILFRAEHLDEAERFMVDQGMPAPARGTRLSGESALLVRPENACGAYVAMAGMP